MKALRRIVPVVLLLAAGVVGWLLQSPHDDASTGIRAEASTAADAFETRRSDVWVEDAGTVVALLRDDMDGSRHQRFLVRLEGGSTILVSHNIDLAPRVPLEKGDEVALRGEYVWNDKGGLVHWTHHDPKGLHPGGWIRFRGREYR